MFRIVCVIAAALVFAASPAFAQDKQAERAKALEAEIAKLRATQAELEAQLKKLALDTGRARGVKEDVDQKRKVIEIELDKALKGKDEQLKRAQEEIEKAFKLKDDAVKRAQGEIEKTLTLKLGQDGRVEVRGQGGRDAVPYEKMTPEQLKELITKLQRILEEKVRNAEREKNVEKGRPGVERRPGAASQDEILKRLDMMQKEIEELKRAIRK
jgi:hypothetical protein